MEKIHGTSAHIKLVRPEEGMPCLQIFSGGESYEKFAALFDLPYLESVFQEKFGSWDKEVVVYGEAYGGKQQGMGATYGPNLRFIVFDIRIGNSWLDVPKAHELTNSLGLEFVDYELISSDISAIEAERDKPSTQAKRNGMGDDKMREGVVLRPPFEVTLNNGGRLIAKFKRPEFSERKSNPTKFDPAKKQIITDAQNVAFEFVTPMRLEHVINRLISSRDDKSYSITDTKKIIDLMVEDIEREGSGEFNPSPAIRKAIGSQTVKLFKKKLEDNLREQMKVSPVVCSIPIEKQWKGIISDNESLEGKSDA